MEMSNTSPLTTRDNDKIKRMLQDEESQCPNAEAEGGKNAGKRKRRLTSGVWKYFRILEAKPGEKLKCQCKKCGTKYSAESKNGTGNLHRHMKKCLKMTTRDTGRILLPFSQGTMSTPKTHFSQDVLRGMLVQAIIMHDLPLSFLEYEGIWDVFKHLEPQVSHVTRNTARADIETMHSFEADRLRNELSACSSRICLTSSIWSSVVTDEYLSLTAHFIDNNWKLQKKILNFSYMLPPRDGVALAENIYSLASTWGIEKKLFSVTSDNASSDDVCVTTLKNKLKLENALVQDGVLFHLRCCAHVLNSIVQDGLKEIEGAVDKIRECVKYIKGSKERKLDFTQCVEQTSLDSKKALVQDVPTRWDTTYRMLSSALYYRLAFCHMQFDADFQSCPSPEEREKVQKICSFLEVFYTAAKAFSESYYPTANLYFPQVFLIQFKLVKECSSSDDFMRRVAEQMFAEFNKYWCEFNLVLAVAVVFDPRYKFGFLEFCYEKLYGPGSQELERVRDTVFGLFDEYLAQSNETYNESPSRSPESTTGSWDMFKEFEELNSIEDALTTQKSQLEMYLDDPYLERTSRIPILDYWKSLVYLYPDVARLARDVLCVPVSTVTSEYTFNLDGRVLDEHLSSLSPEIVESLVCSKDWLSVGKGMSAMSMDGIIQNVMSLNINENGEIEESGEDSD